MKTSPEYPCAACGITHRFSHGVKLGPEWVCPKCSSVLEAMAAKAQAGQMSTSVLIEALIVSGIENHEGDGPTLRSRSPIKLQAIRDELDARLPQHGGLGTFVR